MKYSRNGIDLSTRLEIGAKVYRNQGHYGLVTGLALKHQASRWFIYFCFHLYLNVLMELEDRQIVSESHLYTKTWPEQVLFVYLEGKCSIEGIQKVIFGLTNQHISIGSISTLINTVGSVIPEHEFLNSGESVVVALDELYAKEQPILVTVEPGSNCIGSIRLAKNCTQQTWQQLFDDNGLSGKQNSFVGDGGKGLKAASNTNGRYRLDHFHGLDPLKKMISQFEFTAYKAIEAEQKACNQLQKANAFNESELKKVYENKKLDTLRKTERYELSAWLLRELQQILEPVNLREAKLKTRKQVHEQVIVVVELMKGLNDYQLNETVNAFKKNLDDMLEYLNDAQDVQYQLSQIFEGESIHVQAYLLMVAHQQKASSCKAYSLKKANLKQAGFWEQALREELGEKADTLLNAANHQTNRLSRASSVVENINSLIRPYLDCARSQITQERLNLIRFYLNRRIIRRGKRAGKTPIEIMTGKTSNLTWQEELRQLINKDECQGSQQLAA